MGGYLAGRAHRGEAAPCQRHRARRAAAARRWPSVRVTSSCTPDAGERGVAVYSAHRDTHFRFLKDVVIGDEIDVTRSDGRTVPLPGGRTSVVRFDASGHRSARRTGMNWCCRPAGRSTRVTPGPERYLAACHDDRARASGQCPTALNSPQAGISCAERMSAVRATRVATSPSPNRKVAQSKGNHGAAIALDRYAPKEQQSKDSPWKLRQAPHRIPTEKWSPSPDASDIVKSIHAMLHPRNIVLVGATDKPGNYAERIWNNLIKYKYEGGLFPVNAKRETIWGVPCYKDFASLPEKPDHVLVLVPARFAVQVIRDAAAAGARSATIVTSGFSELQDEDSQRLAAELQQAMRETGLARHRPELPRQSERRRKAVHQHRRPHRHHGSRPGGDRRPIRRDRDGDPPDAGGSRRRRRLHGHDRQRDRPRDAGPDGLFRGRSVRSA